MKFHKETSEENKSTKLPEVFDKIFIVFDYMSGINTKFHHFQLEIYLHLAQVVEELNLNVHGLCL